MKEEESPIFLGWLTGGPKWWVMIALGILILCIAFFVILTGIGTACYLGVDNWCSIGPGESS